MIPAPDLFALPLIPGLATAGDFVTPREEPALIAAINGETLAPFQFQQWTGRRLTHSFGWSYDFQTGALSPAEPMPGWLAAIRDRAAGFAGLAPAALVQALLIRYDPGAGIGWHRDRPIYDRVIGISLGAPPVMRFRQARAGRWLRVAAPLEPRGIYLLSGEVRSAWEHSIVPIAAARWSLTFRSFSHAGQRQAQAARPSAAAGSGRQACNIAVTQQA